MTVESHFRWQIFDVQISLVLEPNGFGLWIPQPAIIIILKISSE